MTLDSRPSIPASSVAEELMRVGYLTGSSRGLPDQPVRTVDPEVERLAHLVVDGLIARLALEPAVPATSLLDNLAGQLEQAAALRRLGVVRRAPSQQQRSSSPVPDATLTRGPAHR
jgi:hypothetical protein